MRSFVAIVFAAALGLFGWAPAPAVAQQSDAPVVHGAEVRISAKKWDEAEQFLKEDALVQFPNSAELWYWLGVVYAQGTKRDTEQAAQAFAKANELANPEDTELKGKIDMAVQAIWAPLVNSAAKAADATIFKNFVGGQWAAPATGSYFENRNPASPDDLIGQFPDSDQRDIDAAVRSAKRGFEIWSRTPAPARGDVLRRVGDLLVIRYPPEPEITTNIRFDLPPLAVA